MLQMQYIGLLNTDRNRRELITMFIQGKHSEELYVLNCLPPWILRIDTPNRQGLANQR